MNLDRFMDVRPATEAMPVKPEPTDFELWIYNELTLPTKRSERWKVRWQRWVSLDTEWKRGLR